jgi:hypothetical protein
MTTTTKTFSRVKMNGHGLGANCRGANHSDYAELFTCDACGESVFRTVREDKNGEVRYGQAHPVTITGNGARRYFCFDVHECDAEAVARVAEAKSAALASGEIVKGSTVRVVKGRKVPLSTTGVVFWIGEDGFGKEKVGFTTAEGEKHFTAKTNVEAVTGGEAT